MGGLAMKTFLGAVVCVVAVCGAAGSSAQAETFNYSPNGTYAADNGNGPSLVPYGGTLAPGGGYFFGVDQGLSLSGTGIYDSYTIDIRFYFDSVNASYNGFQKILDFKNRAQDMGLYSLYGGLSAAGTPAGNLNCFACGSSFIPGRGFFSDGQLAALRITMADGMLSAYINGVYQGTNTEAQTTTFSGPDSIIWFFMDDFATLTTHPDTPEAGSGYIESISISVTQTPLPGAIPLFATGLGALGLLGWRRKRKAA
jgi:hypothetical protein